MNVKKTILVLALFVMNSFCMVAVQAQAASVKETVYEYQRIDNYWLGKKGRITGWKWEKKKQGLIGTKYRWGKGRKSKKTNTIKIQHPYIKEMVYGGE